MSGAVILAAIFVICFTVLIPMMVRREVPGALPARRTRPSSARFDGLGASPHLADTAGVGLDRDGLGAGSVDEDRDDAGDMVTHEDRARRDVHGDRTGRVAHPYVPGRSRRARVLMLRRRRLTVLTLLTLATISVAMAGAVPVWGPLLPAAACAGYLALLREAVRIDVERHAAAAERVAARQAALARARARQAAEAPTDPLAEIIDISARREDIYDQYADAELRAVGD